MASYYSYNKVTDIEGYDKFKLNSLLHLKKVIEISIVLGFCRVKLPMQWIKGVYYIGPQQRLSIPTIAICTLESLRPGSYPVY